MPVFDPLTAGALLLLVAGTPQKCEMPAPTRINVIPKTDGIEYDYKQRLAEIQSVKSATPDPYGIHSSSVTQGFMQGQVQLSRDMKLGHQVINKQGDVCLWYETIDVKIEIDPKIVIAKEVKQDRCMFNAVLDHEKKHINVDRKVVNDTAKRLGDRLYEEIKKTGFVIGPIPFAQAKQRAEEMGDLINRITEDEYYIMADNRDAEQGKVDTLEEYDRVGGLCPHFHKRKKELYKKVLSARERENMSEP